MFAKSTVRAFYKMEKTDKAVSTEDLCIESQRTMCLEAAKLEAVFKTLVENKVEAIKNDDKVKLFSSIHSSPKSFVNRFRLTSSSSVASSKDNHHHHSHYSPNRKHRRRRKSCDEDELYKDIKRARRSGHGKNLISSSSPESPRYRMHRCCGTSSPFKDDEPTHHETLEFIHCDSICSADDCINMATTTQTCCCPNEGNGQLLKMHYSDYVSLKIDDCEDDVAILDREALRRARRKRRKRRKKRMKGHIEITPLPVPEVKELDPDDLPQRARWTIVATACLLLFMCLLLVGVTLRMAPIIDDMVRKENEELMNSLHRQPSGHHVSHNLNPAQAPE